MDNKEFQQELQNGRTDFTGEKLVDVEIKDVTIGVLDLSNTVLMGLRITNASIEKIILDYARLEDCCFKELNCKKLTGIYTQSKGLVLQDCILSFYFYSSTISNTRIESCIFDGTSFFQKSTLRILFVRYGDFNVCLNDTNLQCGTFEDVSLEKFCTTPTTIIQRSEFNNSQFHIEKVYSCLWINCTYGSNPYYCVGIDSRGYPFWCDYSDGYVVVVAGCRRITGMSSAIKHWTERQNQELPSPVDCLGLVYMIKIIAEDKGILLEPKNV